MPQNPERYQIINGKLVDTQAPPPVQGAASSPVPFNPDTQSVSTPPPSPLQAPLNALQEKGAGGSGALMENFLKALGHSLEMGSAFIPGGRTAIMGASNAAGSLGPLVRAITNLVGGGVAGAAEPAQGGSDLLKNVVEGGVSGAALGAIGEALGRAIPQAGTAVGGAIGGAKNPGAVADAVLRTRTRRAPNIQNWVPTFNNPWTKPKGTPLTNTGGIPIGAAEKVRGAIKEGGQKLEQVENASAVHGTAADFIGDTTEAQRLASIANPVTGASPIAGRELDYQAQLTAQQLAKQHGLDPSTAMQLHRDLVAMQKTGKMTRLVQDALGVSKGQAKSSGMSGAEIFDNLTPQVDMSAREMGESSRFLRDKNTIQAQQRGAPVSENAFNKDTADQAMSSAGKGRQLEREKSLGGPTPIADTNAALSDLHTIEEANKQLQSGGSILTKPGQMSARAGMGGIPAAMLAHLFGLDPMAGGAAGSIAALFGLAPRPASGLSMVAGRAAQLAPPAYRASQIKEDLSGGKKPVQRRKP